MALLEARGLVKYYGSRCVVNGVNFEVDAGEVVGLLGPNGAGKTTSFKMTMGFTEPNGGQVLFNGNDVATLQMYLRARLGMGYLPQETSVFRKLSVEQNIIAILEMVPSLRSLKRKPTRAERWELTEKALQQFGLTHVRKNTAARLSGGEKRRLEIARCLVCEPLLILMDEPFTGIDPKTIADIQQIVRDLRKSGIGILLTDHNVREALKITTRSYLIKDGKVRTQGTPYQIVNDPIAINEYLGAGFNDDSFARNPDEQSRPAPQEIRAVESSPVRTEAAAPPPTPNIAPSPAPHEDLAKLVDEGTRTEPAPLRPTATAGEKVKSEKSEEVRKPVAPAISAKEALQAKSSADRQKAISPARPESAPPTPGLTPSPARPKLSDEGKRTDKVVLSTRPEQWSDETPERLVENLKSTNADQAAAALIKKGSAAVPALLAALARRDADLRRQVKMIMEKILQRPVVFDPFAQEAIRMQQLALLRDSFERKAG
jgi:lipopolysaccharide export system ATP-binding protein